MGDTNDPKQKRRHQRISLPLSIKYRIQGELGVSWREGLLVNLSAGGLRFTSDMLSSAQLFAGQRLELQWSLENRPDPYAFQGEIVWTHDTVSRLVECGVEFFDITPDQELELGQVVEFLMGTRQP